MSDSISRQDAIDEVCNMMCECFGADDEILDAIETTLNELPSAQSEIIRCKDCKWSDWYDAADGHKYCYCMETGAAGRTADDFCSYAERKTDDIRRRNKAL